MKTSDDLIQGIPEDVYYHEDPEAMEIKRSLVQAFALIKLEEGRARARLARTLLPDEAHEDSDAFWELWATIQIQRYYEEQRARLAEIWPLDER